MPHKYKVELSASQRAELWRVVQVGKAAARTVRRAYTLLWSADGTADREIAARVGCSVQTVAKTRRRWVQEGWGALVDQARSGRPRCLEGRQEAQLVALACSQPPAERGAWTMQLLADEMVTLGWVATLSRSTVQRVLKKTG